MQVGSEKVKPRIGSQQTLPEPTLFRQVPADLPTALKPVLKRPNDLAFQQTLQTLIEPMHSQVDLLQQINVIGVASSGADKIKRSPFDKFSQAQKN